MDTTLKRKFDTKHFCYLLLGLAGAVAVTVALIGICIGVTYLPIFPGGGISPESVIYNDPGIRFCIGLFSMIIIVLFGVFLIWPIIKITVLAVFYAVSIIYDYIFPEV